MLKNKLIFRFLFILYLLLLLKFIIFKYPLVMIKEILKSFEISSLLFRIENSNYIPFKGIYDFLFNSISLKITLKNLLGNIIAFMPLGFLLAILSSKMRTLKSITLIGFLLSLSFESIQLLTGLGEFDVDDIILNTLGAVVGLYCYKLLKKKNILFRKN